MTKITLFGIETADYTAYENLSEAEKCVIAIIKSTLIENKIPDNVLHFRYTSKYLAVESFKTHPFARIKIGTDVRYIELSCGDKKTGKNFCRFEFTDISEIEKYKEEIIAAFRFCDPNYFLHHYATVGCEGLDEKLYKFFSLLEVPAAGEIFIPTSSEIEFFSAYINKLEFAGLNWENTKARLMARREISVRGGRIRFGEKSSYMTYTESDGMRSIKAQNLSLHEYIELQKYWVDTCLKYKDIYNM